MKGFLSTLAALFTIIIGIITISDRCSDQSSYPGPEPVTVDENVDNHGETTDEVTDDSDAVKETNGQDWDKTVEDNPVFDYVSFEPQINDNQLTWHTILCAKNMRGRSLSFKLRMIVYDEFPTRGQNPIHYDERGPAIYDNSYNVNNVEVDNPRWDVYPDGGNLGRLDLSSGKEYYLVEQVIYDGKVVLSSAPQSFKYTIGY